MKLVQASTVFLVACVTIVNAGYRRVLKTPPPPILFPTKVPNFPNDMHPDALNHLKVPSVEFCKQMNIQPAYHYVVLPWWYHYCQRLSEGKTMKEDKKMPNLGHYKRVLERAQHYKKMYGVDKRAVRRKYPAHIKRL